MATKLYFFLDCFINTVLTKYYAVYINDTELYNVYIITEMVLNVCKIQVYFL